MEKVLLISNSYPYNGETFLRTEIGFLPDGVSVDAWPFFVERTKVESATFPPTVTPHIYKEMSGGGKVLCLLKGMGIFLREGEIKAAIAKSHPIRNIVKAVKFSYISEIRLASIKKWLKGQDTDGYLIYAYWMYEVAYVAARLKKMLPNSRFITRCHGYDLYEQRHPNGYLPYRKYIMNQADLICPISENGFHYIEKLYGNEISRKTAVSRLGTIRKAEIPVAQEMADGIVLVSCSNLVDVKRIYLIINALNKYDKNVIWYHFGDGELMERLQNQAKTLPVNIQYKFMGYCANDDVQKFYADHYIDAFVNVSQSEGIPVSVMEAESYGIPIIATDVGGTSEIAHNGENGVLLKVDFKDEDLLDAVDEVVEKAKNYRAESLRIWRTMCDANIVFPEFYKKVMEV